MFRDVLWFVQDSEIQKSKNAALNNLRDATNHQFPFDLVKIAKFDESSLTSLEDHLAERSYVSGFEPTTSDNLVFEAISNISGLSETVYVNVYRWHRHIQSFGSERHKFVVKSCSRYWNVLFSSFSPLLSDFRIWTFKTHHYYDENVAFSINKDQFCFGWSVNKP